LKASFISLFNTFGFISILFASLFKYKELSEIDAEKEGRKTNISEQFSNVAISDNYSVGSSKKPY
jgi:hypothetical protein